MAPKATKIYHSLPFFARDWVASAWGLHLRRWRYGPETERLVHAAVEREVWTAGRWVAYQSEQLRHLLIRAAERVPFYRQHWCARLRHGEKVGCEDIANWPVLKKASLRNSPGMFLADDCNFRRMWREHTSGSTGTPITLWQSRETLRAWYALVEARWRGWYGLCRNDRWAILGGQLVVPAHQQSPPFWVWNGGLKQLYLSSYHLSAETAAAYIGAIKKCRAVYLWGYASSLYSLALLTREQKPFDLNLKVIISNAEPLYDHQRALIQRVFNCPVRDTYGMSEMVCGASECESGKMHLWPDVGIYEILRDDCDQPVPVGEVGRLVCTGLLNQDMPLIRYEVGDRVAMALPGEQCGCGRSMPILRTVEGRNDDVILTSDGRRIGRLDPVFKREIPIQEAQIVQESLALLRVIIVPGAGFTANHEKALVLALQERVGDMQIHVEHVKVIPRSANGKFRSVISRLKIPQSDVIGN